jgi:hypothetical protein
MYISFHRKKIKKKSQNSRNQGFYYFFACWWKDPDPGGPTLDPQINNTDKCLVYVYSGAVVCSYEPPSINCEKLIPFIRQLSTLEWLQGQEGSKRGTKVVSFHRGKTSKRLRKEALYQKCDGCICLIFIFIGDFSFRRFLDKCLPSCHTPFVYVYANANVENEVWWEGGR